MTSQKHAEDPLVERIEWLEAELALKQGRLERLEIEFQQEQIQSDELRNALIALQSTRPYGVAMHEFDYHEQPEVLGSGRHGHNWHKQGEMVQALGSWCQAASGFMGEQWEASQRMEQTLREQESTFKEAVHEHERMEEELRWILAERKVLEDRARQAEARLAEREALLKEVVGRLHASDSMVRQQERELHRCRARSCGSSPATSIADVQTAALEALSRLCEEALQVVGDLVDASKTEDESQKEGACNLVPSNRQDEAELEAALEMARESLLGPSWGFWDRSHHGGLQAANSPASQEPQVTSHGGAGEAADPDGSRQASASFGGGAHSETACDLEGCVLPSSEPRSDPDHVATPVPRLPLELSTSPCTAVDSPGLAQFLAAAGRLGADADPGSVKAKASNGDLEELS